MYKCTNMEPILPASPTNFQSQFFNPITTVIAQRYTTFPLPPLPPADDGTGDKVPYNSTPSS